MKMRSDPHDADRHEGECDRCGSLVVRYRGEAQVQCSACGANYNAFGQRLRDDLHTRVNMSAYDEEVGDMEGDERSWLSAEAWAERDHP